MFQCTEVDRRHGRRPARDDDAVAGDETAKGVGAQVWDTMSSLEVCKVHPNPLMECEHMVVDDDAVAMKHGPRHDIHHVASIELLEALGGLWLREGYG